MPIVVQCECGKRFGARDELAGKTLACPSCGQALTVPGAAPAPPSAPPAVVSPIVVTCQCGARFGAKPELAGRTLACPKCGQSLTVPHPTASEPATVPAKAAPPKRPAPQAPVAPAPAAGIGDLLDEVGLTPTKTGVRCIKCRADMKPGAVICVQCGYNHETETYQQTKRWT